MRNNRLNFDYLDPTRRDVAPRAGQIGCTSMRVKSIDDAKRQIHFLCSTDEIDRYNESIDKPAWEAAIPPFMTNAVFPAGHVYIGMSGEPTIIGSWVKLWVSKDGLEGIAQFDDEENELATKYWNLYRKGHMKAVSVGFIAVAWEMRDVMIGTRPQRTRVFTEVELIEISAVAIGANRSALVRAASAPAPGDDASDDASGDRLTRLESLIEQLSNTIRERPESRPPRGTEDDAALERSYLAHFMDGDFSTGDDTDSRAADETESEEINDYLRGMLAPSGAGSGAA